MMKVLFVATVDIHIISFHIPFLKWFKDRGFEVHVASNGNSSIPFVDVKYNIPFNRSPFRLNNITAYLQLKRIIDTNHYKIVHCHTPVGSVLTRLASIAARKKGTKVVYSAHGFHFFKEAPTINWLLYYPIEKWLSKHTDCLITTNIEDYNNAITKFHSNSIKHIHGVGIDLSKFTRQSVETKNKLREKYQFKNDDFILIFAGELSYRKHQDLLISVIGLLKEEIPNIKLLLVGVGGLSDKYNKQVKQLRLEKNVLFLGYQNKLDDIMGLSDVAVSSSRQEGLPVNVMMAMAIGLPIIVTNCRGNKDLVTHGENGFNSGINDVEGFANLIRILYKSENLRIQFGKKNLELIQIYSLDNIIEQMALIYKSFI